MNERADCPSSSALDRLVKCSASHNMGLLAQSMSQPHQEPSKDMEFGLKVHKALQNKSAKSLTADDERLAYSVMSHQRGKFIDGWLAQGKPGKGGEELLEHRMWLHNGATPVFSGQADYILIAGNRALILDYKSLWNKAPEPADNQQLKSLATLLWLSRPNLREITIQIIASHYTYTPCVLIDKELAEYLEFLQSVITLVNQAQAPVAGEWCKHCRGMLICPAIRKRASDLLKADADGSFPSRLPTGQPGAAILEEMAALSKLIERVRDHYKGLITENPTAIPGWTLQTATRRKFNNVKRVFGMLQTKFRDSVFDLIDISVSRTYAKLNPIEQQTLEAYVERTESEPSLRPRKEKNGVPEI